MPSPDHWISLREKLLDIVSGSDRARTLNPSTLLRTGQVIVPNADSMNGDPAAELVDLLHEVISGGLADHGENVDYAALKVSPLYDEFRHCTAKLHAFDPSILPDRNARLAFWIDLYNTLVLDGVITLGVQHSIVERRAGMTFLRQADRKSTRL